MKNKNQTKKRTTPEWKQNLYKIIFEADTPGGKAFDIILLISIILSVIVVLLDSVAGFHAKFGKFLFISEWIFTILFTVEYVFRIITSLNSRKYIFSFYGIIDLLAILPTYLSLVFAGTQYLMVIRILRLLRVFRILKLDRYIGASGFLLSALKNSRHKIAVFIGTVLTIVVIMGSAMYLIEGPENGFTNIPESIYWAIVTLTTVGYGDIAPVTFSGKVLASFIMILGFSIIAVPTGIITVEMSQIHAQSKKTKTCINCNKSGHDEDAEFCKYCGNPL